MPGDQPDLRVRGRAARMEAKDVKELFELAKTLVNIESITGGERPCIEFVRDSLAASGFQVELQPVSPGRSNVFAYRGTPTLVLSTHLDTVPPFIPAREDSKFIYGRGSCDAKGIAACQLTAASRLVKEGVGDFGVLLLIGEETISDGARAANLASPGSKYIISGEPTENKLAVGTKGNLRVDIRTQGRMAHSAYPQLGESAIDKLLVLLADVRKLPLPDDPSLGPSTVNIGVVSGGRAANVVPDRAEAQVMFRTVPSQHEGHGLRAQVEQLLRGRCEFEFVRETPPLMMETVDGFETTVVAFSTDLPSLPRWGKPLLLGPGSVHDAHTEHEKVRKADLVRAVDLYCRLVRELKARG